GPGEEAGGQVFVDDRLHPPPGAVRLLHHRNPAPARSDGNRPRLQQVPDRRHLQNLQGRGGGDHPAPPPAPLLRPHLAPAPDGRPRPQRWDSPPPPAGSGPPPPPESPGAWGRGPPGATPGPVPPPAPRPGPGRPPPLPDRPRGRRAWWAGERRGRGDPPACG